MPIRPENRGRYPADWADVRARILERARDFYRHGGTHPRCECEGECGRGTHTGRCPNFDGHDAYGTGSTVVLTIAHLDHTPENNADDNLRAMCQGCHLHYDRDHHAQTRAATRRRTLADAGQLTLDPGGNLAVDATHNLRSVTLRCGLLEAGPSDEHPLQERTFEKSVLLPGVPYPDDVVAVAGTPFVVTRREFVANDNRAVVKVSLARGYKHHESPAIADMLRADAWEEHDILTPMPLGRPVPGNEPPTLRIVQTEPPPACEQDVDPPSRPPVPPPVRPA